MAFITTDTEETIALQLPNCQFSYCLCDNYDDNCIITYDGIVILFKKAAKYFLVHNAKLVFCLSDRTL